MCLYYGATNRSPCDYDDSDDDPRWSCPGTLVGCRCNFLSVNYLIQKYVYSHNNKINFIHLFCTLFFIICFYKCALGRFMGNSDLIYFIVTSDQGVPCRGSPWGNLPLLHEITIEIFNTLLFYVSRTTR